jgi:hypothetical protein
MRIKNIAKGNQLFRRASSKVTEWIQDMRLKWGENMMRQCGAVHKLQCELSATRIARSNF